MKKKIILVGAALSLAIFSACSSDDHSSTSPEDDTLSSSSSLTLDDIDKLLGSSSSTGKDNPASSDNKSSSSVSKTSSSSGEKTTSSSSEKTVESSSAVVIDDDGFKRAACDMQSDEGTLLALDLINEKSIKMFEAFSDKDMEAAKSLSAEVKPMYKKVLDKDSKNCNAQLGYAIASIVDLANNETLRGLYDDYKYWYDYGIESVAEFTTMLADLSKNKSFTKIAQDALDKEVAPMVDSAITYMQNIMAQGDYILNIRDGEYIRELDNSEFGVALGGLFATKAAIIMATSMNLEIDVKGSYDWINGINGMTIGKEEPTQAQKDFIVQFVKLVGLDGTFTTIYTDRQKAWKTIPSLIDSAITEARVAFQYSLDESKKKNSQDNDLYVVGNGADADVGIDDIQEILDGLDTALKVTRGTYEVKYRGQTIKIDARKYFENVDGIEKFLPYYEFDGSDLASFNFTDKSGKKTASLLDFMDGTLSFLDDCEEYIVFRDPSFGGIFPEFKTQADIWSAVRGADDEEEDW